MLKGCIEVTTFFEESEFILENIYEKSWVNPHNFLLEDELTFNFKAKEPSILLVLDRQKFIEYVENHKSFEKDLLLF